MTSVTLDLGIILGAFGAVVTALLAVVGALKWMYNSYEKRLNESIKRCEADNAQQKITNDLLKQGIKELRIQLVELNFRVGYLSGRKDANEPEPHQK